MSADVPRDSGRTLDHDAGVEMSISADGATTLPLSRVVMGRGFVTGKSGSGKSNSVGVVVEELLDRGVPALIVDTDGEHVALKEEYELLHVGASAECDVTVTPDSAATVADIALDRHVPTILDTSEFFSEDDVTDLVASVARRLFVREKSAQKPLLLVLEECHEFLPQKGKDDASEMFTKIAKRGRKRGLGIVGISQRPADVSKAFITQCDWLAIHRLTWPNDTAVVRDVVDAAHADAVEDLATGESFLMTDWDNSIRRVQWRRKHTPDYGAAPPIESALGTTPDRIGADVFAAFEDDEEGEGETTEGDVKNSKSEILDEPDGGPMRTYTVHEGNTSRAYVQLGKPVSQFFDLTDDDSVDVEFGDGEVFVTADDGPDATYSAFDHAGRGYCQVNLGARAIDALGAEVGDTVRVDTCADGETLRVSVVEDDR